jgi:threonine dehydratase
LAEQEVTLLSIRRARQRIAAHVRCTPVLRNETLDTLAGAQLFFKSECLQQTGAFKARGAVNAVLSLPAGRLQAGVVTHSSGNHGAAVAYAAQLRGARATVVMPENSSAAKFDAVRSLGAQVLTCEPTVAAREAMAAQVVASTGAAFVHPYDDPDVIAGQGTVALELLEQQPDLQMLWLPVGGGGLISGVATAVKAVRPDIRVIGVEPAGADDAQRSWRQGSLVPYQAAHTIADGLRGSLSERTLSIMRRVVDDIITVDEPAIVRAMRTLWLRLKLTVEASSAVPYAAILERSPAVDEAMRGRRIGVVLTGGNVDLDRLPWL